MKLSTIIMDVAQRLEKGYSLLVFSPLVEEINSEGAITINGGRVKARIEKSEYFLSKQRLSEAKALKIASLFSKFIFEASLPIYSAAKKLSGLSTDLIMDCHRVDNAVSAEKEKM